MTDEHSTDLAKAGEVASAALRLRTAVSIALVALAELEQAATLDAAKAKARETRQAIRRALKPEGGAA